LADFRSQGSRSILLTDFKLDDFDLLAIIGKGAFGKVMLAKDHQDNIYAMKRIRKDLLLENDVVENFMVERKVLFDFDNPFILKMKHCFESKLRYYFFLEFISGGDMYQHLK